MTVFFRVLESSVDEKATALRKAINGSGARFEVPPSVLGQLPGSPFAYWISENVRNLFGQLDKFENEEAGRYANAGTSTGDDARFTRLWTEVSESSLSTRWRHYTRGGKFARYYSDVGGLIDWLRDGLPIELFFAGGRVRKPFYGRPGLTWPLRGVRFSAQAVPAGCIFSVAGKMAFAAPPALEPLLGIFNSTVFDHFIGLSAGKVGGVQYEVGIIQNLPLPNWTSNDQAVLGRLAKRAWSLKQSLDTSNELSHAFLMPAGLKEKVAPVDETAVERELLDIQSQIDDQAFGLYGIGAEDRANIEAPGRQVASDADEGNLSEDADEGDDEPVVEQDSEALGSWLVGVAFGRFDPRLATGERAIPPEPEPFDPLPARSPGMYPEGEEPADRPDILVDDEGHADDLTARAMAVAERVKVAVPENLRGWLAKEFFPLHIKMYSKSRRKAPIYWQLATPSASYSVWLYLHAFSKDTLFRVQNEYVGGERGKLAHEERRLEALTSEMRDGATAAQRKQLATQETLVEELRAFLDEVKRIAPLWGPNLDDGVIINFAPLWRLVPQNKSWQKELKSTWDALCEGKYDWAHLAMHLWPERVVPKCAKDRSLAIAHGLEDVFWVEGQEGRDAGKWTTRKTPTKTIEELVKERTSPAVKSALKSLLEAPAASGAAKKSRKGRTNA